MSRIIVDKQIIVIALGIFTAIGILSKCIVNAILSRLLNMPVWSVRRWRTWKCLWTSTCMDIRYLGSGFIA